MHDSSRHGAGPLLGWVAGLVCLALFVMGAVMVCVPRMVEFSKDIGVKELPTLTQVLVDFSDFMKPQAGYLLLLFAAAAIAVWFAVRRRR